MSVISRLRKIVTYTLSAFVLLLLLVWGISFVVLPWQVNKQLEPLGLALNEKASLSFNPFSLHIQIDDLAIVDKANIRQLSLKHAHVNVSWMDFLSKQVIIELASVESLHLNVLRTNKQLVVAGIDLLAQKNEPVSPPMENAKASPENDVPLTVISGWRFLIPHFSMNDVAVSINDYGHAQRVVLKRFSVKALNASLNELRVNVALDAAINESSLNVTSEIHAKLDAMKLVSASLDNQLTLSRFSLQDWQYVMPLADNDVSVMEALIDFTLTQKITLTDDRWHVIQPQLRLALSEITVTKPELELRNQSLVFELKDLAVNGVGEQLTQAAGLASLKVNGINVTTDGQTLASLGNVDLAMAKFSIDEAFNAVANVDNITLKEVVFSQSTSAENAIYHNDKLTINDISWSGNHLAIDSINVGKFNSEVILSAEKELKNLVSIKQVGGTKSEAPTSSHPAEENSDDNNTSTPITLSLNKFELTAPSNIKFTDEGVKPLFKHEIILKKALVTNVDSRDQTKNTPFDVALEFDEHATTTLKGAIAPFSNKINMSLDLKTSEFSLPPLSTYLRTVLGFDFLSGQLDNHINLVIKDDEIDGETVIGLRGFELASGNDSTDLSASDGSAIGLNSALNMLKDGQGNVSLEVPLSGNINDPSFGISSVITLVAQKAIMAQAKLYLINTFVPYANVVTIASIAGEYLLQVEMNDLNYAAGQSVLSQIQQPFVIELAALLTDKPKQQVKMCAIASVQEVETVAKGLPEEQQLTALKKLSKDRGETLKTTLIEHYKIASARLLLCAPRIDSDEGSLPRIEFSF